MLPTHTTSATVTDARDAWAISGFVAVAAFLGGLVASNVLGDRTYPSPTEPAAGAAAYFAENALAVDVQAFTQVVSSLALLVFAATLARRLAGGPHGPLVLAGGTAAAALMLVSAGVSWSLASAAPDAAVTAPLHALAFAAGGPANVAAGGLLVGAGALGLRGVLPDWLTWFGAVVAVVALASPLALLLDSAVYLLPVGRFGGFVWIVGAAVVLLRERSAVR